MEAKLKQYRAMFMEECQDHLQTLERCLRDLVASDARDEIVDECFRAAHSIKGGAGMFGLDRLVPAAHALESALEQLRLGTLPPTQDNCHALARVADCIFDMVEAEKHGLNLPVGFENLALEALSRLAGIAPEAGPFGFFSTPPTAREPESDIERNWTISFIPHKGLLRRACEPLLLIRQLRELGELKVVADVSALPSFAELDPLDAWISWTFELKSTQSRADIETTFEFVLGDCELKITAAGEPDVLAPPSQVRSEPLSEPNLEPQLGEQALPSTPALEQQPSAVRVAEVLYENVVPEKSSPTIRVDVEKIDKLVNLAGEIAISQALVSQLFDQTQANANPRLFQELTQLLVHVQSLQDSVMSIRAQMVRTVFDRMPRLIRELSDQLGKKISLRVTGEQTEIDKTVIEQLADPIMHAIRNAADHGIEMPFDRMRVGKPAEGMITLHAEQRGSRVLISVSDDGRGLERDRIRQKAVERKLVSPDAELSAEEIDNLIFLPGFTTAHEVTDISGRGVGMDVVRRNVQKFGGKVSIRSEPGKGSTVTMALPLTLAVLDGMIVRCGNERFVIPVANIIECRANWQPFARSIPGAGTVLEARGRLVSVASLGRIFGAGDCDGPHSTAVLTDIDGDQLAAFLVDEIVGQQQVVVKPVAGGTGKIAGIAGATILGDGRVALIIDPEEAKQLGNQAKHQLQILQKRTAA